MLEYIERYHPKDGSVRAVLRGAGPFNYTIVVAKNDSVTSVSYVDGLKGSFRYYTHRSMRDAMEHGIKWAKRRINEADRRAA